MHKIKHNFHIYLYIIYIRYLVLYDIHPMDNLHDYKKISLLNMYHRMNLCFFHIYNIVSFLHHFNIYFGFIYSIDSSLSWIGDIRLSATSSLSTTNGPWDDQILAAGLQINFKTCNLNLILRILDLSQHIHCYLYTP